MPSRQYIWDGSAHTRHCGEMFRRILVFCSVVAVALAAVSIRELVEKPERFKDVEGCYIVEIDNVIPVGAKVSVPPESGCYRYLCGETNLEQQSCGVRFAKPPLKVVYDRTKQYPDCCGRVVHEKDAH